LVGGVIGFSVAGRSGPPSAYVLDGAGGLLQSFLTAEDEDDGGHHEFKMQNLKILHLDNCEI